MASAASSASPLRSSSSASTGGMACNEVNTKKSGSAALSASQDKFATMRKGVMPLTTSKFANQTGQQQSQHDPAKSPSVYPMDTLLAKLSEQHAALKEQSDSLKNSEADTGFGIPAEHHFPCTPSIPMTSAADAFGLLTGRIPQSTNSMPKEGAATAGELLRLKLELAQAQNKISRLDQELAHSRVGNSEGAQFPSMVVDPEFPIAPVTEIPVARNSTGFSTIPAAKPLYARDDIWSSTEPIRTEAPESNTTMGAISTIGPLGPIGTIGTIGRSRNIWRTDVKAQSSGFQQSFATLPSISTPMSMADVVPPPQTAPMWPPMARPGNLGFAGSPGTSFGDSFSIMDDDTGERLTPDSDILMQSTLRRRGQQRLDAHPGSSQSFGSYNSFNIGQGLYDTTASEFSAGSSGQLANSTGLGMFPQYQQQPIGTPLSPHASEFTAANAPQWKSEQPVAVADNQTFMPTTEPLNYRRLLDRNVNCNWKYIVDKIVCSNDQQASIFLQQKLKVGTADQKYDIVEAIVAQAYPLMINRFGNFLVQRCFEHGTPEQIVKIAEAIRGNTLNLSMDPFGCHVVQKAFDSVPEDYKAIMVHELLRRIPETVIHRYACHVWQKLFELRWNDSPPQIMKYVNEALRGMWHEVALGETGSLVVQNIFENCLEEDKRPCIEEVLANIDVVAHGQFGNWCIQHICEHGAPPDRGRAIDHVIRYAAEYSMDQFASKVVEKCLKIGSTDFLGRYLDRVCEGRVDRPRIPLIDIASDQYGNYLIQYILTHANPQHREIVAAHIRKHMVSLRGSKFGSRVGMLCTNPAVATRPGPGVGPSVGRLPPRYGAGQARHRISGSTGIFTPD